MSIHDMIPTYIYSYNIQNYWLSASAKNNSFREIATEPFDVH